MFEGLKNLSGSKKGTLATLSSVIVPLVGFASKSIGLDPEFVMTIVGSVFGTGIAGQAYVDRQKVQSMQDLGFSQPAPPPPIDPPSMTSNAGKAGMDLVGMVGVGMALLLYLGSCQAQNLATARVTAIAPTADGHPAAVIDLRTNGDTVVGFSMIDATIAVFDRNTGEPIIGPFELKAADGIRLISKSREVSETIPIGGEMPKWVLTEGFFRPGEGELLNYFKVPDIAPGAGIETAD